MALADTPQQRLLERLRQAGEQPVAFAELHAGGIDFPAAVVSELELDGYAFERVYDHGWMVGVRLVGPEPPEAPPPHTGAVDARGRIDSQPLHALRFADRSGCEPTSELLVGLR